MEKSQDNSYSDHETIHSLSEVAMINDLQTLIDETLQCLTAMGLRSGTLKAYRTRAFDPIRRKWKHEMEAATESTDNA